MHTVADALISGLILALAGVLVRPGKITVEAALEVPWSQPRLLLIKGYLYFVAGES